jgi:hypothetical protein
MEAGARQLGHTSSPQTLSLQPRGSSSIFPLFLYLSPLPLSFPSSSLFPPSLLRFSFYLTLLFFLHLCISSSIFPCLPFFSIILFFYLNSFPHLSFSFSSSSSTSTLLLCFSSLNVLFFLCLYLSSYVIYPSSLFFSSMFLLHLQHSPFPLLSPSSLVFFLFQFSLSLLLISLSRTSKFQLLVFYIRLSLYSTTSLLYLIFSLFIYWSSKSDHLLSIQLLVFYI